MDMEGHTDGPPHPRAGRWLMKHLCTAKEQPSRLLCPPLSILPLLAEPGWVSPASGSRGDTATPRYQHGWVLPSHLPSHPPGTKLLSAPLPRSGEPSHRGCPSRVCPVSPSPPRVGIPAAKCPLSIRRQARDYRGRLFEAETNRKSFSQLPFGDINTAGRGSAGSAVPGGAVGCGMQTHGHAPAGTHTLARTDTRSPPGQQGVRGTRRGSPARKGCECERECERECECPALGRSLAPGWG